MGAIWEKNSVRLVYNIKMPYCCASITGGNMLDQRKQSMESIRKNLENELKQLEQQAQLGMDFEGLVFSFPRLKFQNVCLRGFYAYAVYEYIREQASLEGIEIIEKENEYFFKTQLPFIFEIIISIQYLTNQILDGKGGVFQDGGYNQNKINENLIAGAYLKEVLYEYIENNIFTNNLYIRNDVIRFTRNAFQLVDEAQFLEKRHSSLGRFKNGFSNFPSKSLLAKSILNQELIDSVYLQLIDLKINPKYGFFIKFYLERIYLLNSGPFILITDLIISLLKYQGVERKRIMMFAQEFGLLAQMINDLIDVLPEDLVFPTASKFRHDTFSDIRNGNVTLPGFFLHELMSEEEYLKSEKNVDKLLFQYKIFDTLKPVCYEIIIPFLQKWATSLRRNYLNETNNFYAILGDINSIAWGKGIKPFGKIQKKQKQSKKNNF